MAAAAAPAASASASLVHFLATAASFRCNERDSDATTAMLYDEELPYDNGA